MPHGGGVEALEVPPSTSRDAPRTCVHKPSVSMLTSCTSSYSAQACGCHSSSRGQNTQKQRGQHGYQGMLSLLEESRPELNTVAEPEYLDLGIVLDSGAADHVVNKREAPGYKLRPSTGSKAGACFIAANGDAIPNQGEITVQMQVPTSAGTSVPVNSTFQAASISRPLWSVGKICDAGYFVVFDKDHAKIFRIATGAETGMFQRRNGLYVGQTKLRNPASEGFPRQE